MQNPVGDRLEAIAANPRTPDDILLRMTAGPARLAYAVARRTQLTPAVVDALVTHHDRLVRAAFLENWTTAVADRVRLADDPHFGIRMALVMGPQIVGIGYRREPLPESVVIKLAGDHDARVRGEVVVSPDVSAASANVLSKDPDDSIRATVCRRHWHILTPAARAMLLRDPDDEVRLAALLARDSRREGAASRLLEAGVDADNVARHCVLDVSVSDQLARHPDAGVRLAAAENLTLASPAVERLAADENDFVRLAVSVRPELDEADRAAIDYAPALRRAAFAPLDWVVRHHADPDIMGRCARSGHVLLRRSAARSTTLPPDVVALLADDPDDDVRYDLCAHNPDAPQDVLMRFVLNRSPNHPWVPLLYAPAFEARGLRHYADHALPAARALVSRDPEAPGSLIERLSHDPDLGVRAAMAADPRLSPDRIVELFYCPDLDPRVAGANPGLPESVMRTEIAASGLFE